MGANPHPAGVEDFDDARWGRDLWQETVDREGGSIIHRLVGELLRSPGDVRSRAREAIAAVELPGVRAAAVRARVVSGAVVYLDRFAPRDAELVAVEEELGCAVADLVFAHDERMLIDEIKTGNVDFSDSQLLDQLTRLCDGGSERWGERFLGVRVAAVGRPRRSCLVTRPAGLLEFSPLPGWMEVR